MLSIFKPDVIYESQKLVSEVMDEAGLHDTAEAHRQGKWGPDKPVGPSEFHNRAIVFWHGPEAVPVCKDGIEAHFLCDYPVGRGKTCDLPLCSQCRRNIGPEKDLCEIHLAEFVAKSGSARLNPWPPKRA